MCVFKLQLFKLSNFQILRHHSFHALGDQGLSVTLKLLRLGRGEAALASECNRNTFGKHLHATGDMFPVATRDMSPGATGDTSHVATGAMSSEGEALPTRLFEGEEGVQPFLQGVTQKAVTPMTARAPENPYFQ